MYAHDAQRRYPGNYLQECIATWRADPEFEPDLPYYGFSSVDLAIEHGDCPEGHFLRWLKREHPDAVGLAGRANAIPTPDYVLAQHGQAWRTRLPEALHPTAWIADRAIERMQRAVRAEKPFFVYCSFPDPHHPYTPPGKYWDMYQPENIDLPPSFGAAEGPPHWRWLQDENAKDRAVKNSQACFAASEREAREAIALNWGALSFIDAQIGRVLAALKASGNEDDTVVIFTSDHGEFAGEHALLLKGSLHYGSLTRTPLIWRGPGIQNPGRRDHALLSTVDISLSILEQAGVSPFNGMQGRSFMPLIWGQQGYRARRKLLIEEDGQRIYYGFDHPVRMRTLLTPTHRLSVYDGVAGGELYDRQNDPDETRNLWDDPAAHSLRAALHGELASALMHACDTSPLPTAFA